MTTSKYKNTYI